MALFSCVACDAWSDAVWSRETRGQYRSAARRPNLSRYMSWVIMRLPLSSRLPAVACSVADRSWNNPSAPSASSRHMFTVKRSGTSRSMSLVTPFASQSTMNLATSGYSAMIGGGPLTMFMNRRKHSRKILSWTVTHWLKRFSSLARRRPSWISASALDICVPPSNCFAPMGSGDVSVPAIPAVPLREIAAFTCITCEIVCAAAAFGSMSSPAAMMFVPPTSESDTGGLTPGADCLRVRRSARNDASTMEHWSLSETFSIGTRYVAIPRTALA